MYLEETEYLKFDLDFALRLFDRKKILEAKIIVLGLMGNYDEAVDLSIKNHRIDYAKKYASKPSEELSKKLWLKIVKYMFEEKLPIDDIIQLTQETPSIQIDDLLQYFNEETEIEKFKDEICKSLQTYNQEIERLKEELQGYS